jgi:hypothetical protein
MEIHNIILHVITIIYYISILNLFYFNHIKVYI